MRVSVIIPTFCRAPLLCEAVESVLRQDFDDCEIIVVDDGSTDDTRERMLRYGARVRYEYQENQGLSAARNNGLTVANGEFIAFLDDDDWWMPGKLTLQIQVLERLPEVAAVFSNFAISRGHHDVSHNGMQTWYDPPLDWRAMTDRELRAQDLDLDSPLVDPDTALYVGSLYEPSLERYFVLPSTAVVRRSLVPHGLVFPEHDPICGDWDFFARLSKNAPLCFVDCDTTYNRSHDIGYRMTRTKAVTQIEHRVDFLERVYVADQAFYAKHRTDVDRVWKERLAQLCRLQLLDSNMQAARKTASKFKEIAGSGTTGQRLTMAATLIPGAAALMRLARWAKRQL